jgi:Ca2+-transporting ATPase
VTDEPGTGTSITAGLTSAEATRRLAEEGPNELPTAKPRDLVHETGHVLREPMLLLLLGAGIVNLLLAAALDATPQPSRPQPR